jgi:hypothetical protein
MAVGVPQTTLIASNVKEKQTIEIEARKSSDDLPALAAVIR